MVTISIVFGFLHASERNTKKKHRYRYIHAPMKYLHSLEGRLSELLSAHTLPNYLIFIFIIAITMIHAIALSVKACSATYHSAQSFLALIIVIHKTGTATGVTFVWHKGERFLVTSKSLYLQFLFVNAILFRLFTRILLPRAAHRRPILAIFRDPRPKGAVAVIYYNIKNIVITCVIIFLIEPGVIIISRPIISSIFGRNIRIHVLLLGWYRAPTRSHMLSSHC
mmetsp:Transcript_14921/g.16553  ORF Transcript_14921/g.16553 Transcript_14921/m.16553 type:complete len:224 (-) Transcript_14921:2143-2814(-)